MAENLMSLIASGKLSSGTRLHHEGRLRAEWTVTATVTKSGIDFGGRTFTTPSAAARAITGGPVDGWLFWKLPSGEALGTLRAIRNV
jgi:Protein of unknown function (DUF2924)